MKKFMPMPQKNDNRGAKASISKPACRPARRYSKPSAKRICQFNIAGRASFLYVITADADAVEFRHLGGGVGKDIGDDPHGLGWRIDIGVAHHIFFEDIVLDGAAELRGGDALFFRGDDVEGEHGQDGAVHRHRNRHLVERDAIEEDLHIEYAIDGDAGHADIADNARMIGVVAAMGGEVEGDGQSLLARSQVAAVEGVALFGGGVTGVLANRPGAQGVHRRVGSAQEGREAGDKAQVLDIFQIGGGMQWLDINLFERAPKVFVGA